MILQHPALLQTRACEEIERNGQCHTQAVDTLKRAGKQHQHDPAVHRVAQVAVDTTDHKLFDIVNRPPEAQKGHDINGYEGGDDDDRAGDLQRNQYVEQHTLCTKHLYIWQCMNTEQPYSCQQQRHNRIEQPVARLTPSS